MMSESSDVPDLAAETEADSINRRREIQNLPPIDETGTVGLALSGGGIRSATFCLGLVRALAKKGLLKKFDYLSTVSGGGYLGGMLGRLYKPDVQPEVVENALASDDSILLAWLRNNGRYLTPAGFLDKSLAITQIFRSFFAALFLVTLMCLVVSGIAISLNTLLVLRPESQATMPWLIALSVPLFFSAALAVAYWILDEEQPEKSIQTAFVVAACCYLVLALITDFLYYIWFSCWPLIPLIIIGAINARLIKIPLTPLSDDAGKLRQQLTRAMSKSLWLTGTIIILWVIYGLGLVWSRGNFISTTLLPPAVITLLKIIWEIDGVKTVLRKLTTRSPLVSMGLIQSANMLGYLLIGFSLITVCAAEIHFMRYDSLLSYVIWPLLLSLGIIIFFWFICQPQRIISFLNLSSLHHLYRSRIERAWLSVANVGTRPNHRFGDDPLSDKFSEKLSNIEKVTIPLPDDDIQFNDYQPHKKQGPIHLITCCINQTVDDRTGNYNADRKGIALTVSSFGIETGTHLPEPTDYLKQTTLSQWIAISGAAAATGMGSRTAPGLAFMLFLIGGRLGYWENNLEPKNEVTGSLPALFAEMLARFPGKKSQYWYLSDGGHFENTGVYPLLKRRVKTIVVADCGADPEFIFDDLENLVRKARIDYGISIFFSPTITGKRTSVAQLKEGGVCLPLIKARIYYPKTANHDAMLGKLIIVKPHLLEGMGLDTASYAERHPDFPQQTTGDQFFDEEQWEAYHQLGLQAGKAITAAMLK